MDNMSSYLGCAFGQNEAKGVVKSTHMASVELLVGRLDIQFETKTPASVEYDLDPTRIDENKGNWPYKQAVGNLLWTRE